MELKDIRSRIDQIDYEIIKLLNERVELGLRTRKQKTRVEDKQREKEVIQNVEKIPLKLVSKPFSKKLFESIIEETKKRQLENPTLVGFKGEHGASGEMAVQSYNKDYVPIPCAQYLDVVEGVKHGAHDIGILPVESSSEGGINEVNDLLIAHDIYICGEIKQSLNYALLTLPETDYRGIKEVYAHPETLAQCSKFLTRNHLEGKPYYDSASAARMIAESKPRAAAAIAGTLCAELHNLQVIKENIEDDTAGYTRFVFISRQKNTEPGNKCSIIFSTLNKFGELYNILKIFNDAEISLARIESRPSWFERGSSIFLLDFDGCGTDPKINAALEAVEKRVVMFKFLGCYNAAN